MAENEAADSSTNSKKTNIIYIGAFISLIVLIFFFFSVANINAVTFGNMLQSFEVDQLCNETDSILYRNGTLWGCGVLANGSGGNGSGGNVSVGGVEGSIQFNDNGNLNGSDTLIFNKTENILYLGDTANNAYLGVKGITQFGLITPSFGFNSSTGSLNAGMNTVATPSSAFGAAIALGVNTDTLHSPLYTVEAIGDKTFAVHGRALASSAISIGAQSYASKANSIAIGLGAEATGQSALAFGTDTVASELGSFTFGNGAESLGVFSTAVSWAKVTGNRSINIGLRGTANNFGDYYDLTKNDSFVVSGASSSTPEVLLEAEFETGVRIGAITGENITMDGDDLFVADNTEINGFLVLGNNTEDGLSDGDINASTVYYDTLTAKSPIVMCSLGDLKCLVIDVEAEKEYYITIDENYNILSTKDKGDKNNEQVTSKVQDKFNKLKDKKIRDTAKKDCLEQGQFYYFDSTCKYDEQSACESDGFSVYINGTCRENPYLKCESDPNNTYNVTSKACNYDAKKACFNSGQVWTGKSCVEYKVPDKTDEQKQQQCLKDKQTIWHNGACIKLDDYYK